NGFCGCLKRNIRAGLDPDGPSNKKIRAAFIEVAEGKTPASAFVFNHNGITLAAEQSETEGERAHVIRPRVLNGAQTITSFAKFIENYHSTRARGKHANRLDEIRFLEKIVMSRLPGALQPVGLPRGNRRSNPKGITPGP